MIKYLLATIIITILLKYFQFSPLSFWETEGSVILITLGGYFLIFIVMKLQLIGHLLDLIRPSHQIHYYCKSCSKVISDKKEAHPKRCPYCKKKIIRIIDKGSYIKFSPSIYGLKMIQKNDFVYKFKDSYGEKQKKKNITWHTAMKARSKTGGFTDWCLPTKSNWMDIFHILDICNIQKVLYWTPNVDPDYPDQGAWCAAPYHHNYKRDPLYNHKDCTGAFYDLAPGGEPGYEPIHARLCRRKGSRYRIPSH